ncbi:3-phosphoshikimate 1-carboxyvinyltransferase [Hymenobacter sp. M29]|uniref:3-phosphoshikimate 1-carboxyvinyltransferase n=1 Tax=Hymenobacter mellowenesis TaxID=3063995 RepID=A0ABT9AKA4_9BACT|nr:3-phosphoshikimate 1-carboxyvinyltransferase [Hymenobacter sp. M29]MDO7849516.1 3-phosphoshikimate 1-carboxyvinyltransferase [Hymenobacter sp. M29]
MQLSWPGGPLRGTAILPASKSEANRALILQALAGGGTVDNLSDANDTQLMQRLLLEAPNTDLLDAEDAGTVMRFLTAYLAVTGWRGRLTGTARAQERPIGVLVEALRQAGAHISYLNAEGYPPLEFGGFSAAADATEPTALSVRGDISSQYISALLMVGPQLAGGLRLTLTGTIGSRPYITMTAALMQLFGANVAFEGDVLTVQPGQYQPTNYTVESDWSAASYWYALVALSPPGASVTLPGLRLTPDVFRPNLDRPQPNSLQGDSDIVGIMQHFGVKTEIVNGQARLLQTPALRRRLQHPEKTPLPFDFRTCPDLAQTVAVVGAALGVPLRLTGLASLRIKETDRILALQTELAKFGATLAETAPGVFDLTSENFQLDGQTVETYEDHRMAMAFAPLAMLGPVHIENPGVVRKSYPQFWKELAQRGVVVSEAD